jgi:hypothetical protein
LRVDSVSGSDIWRVEEGRKIARTGQTTEIEKDQQ